LPTMSVKILVKLDFPADKYAVVDVDEKQTFADFKKAAAKALSSDLEGYTYMAVGYRTLPIELAVSDSTLVLNNKEVPVTNGTTVLGLAPAHIKPVIKRVKKEVKKEEKTESNPKTAVYKQFTVKNALSKFKSFDEQKNEKSKKHALEYIEMYTKDIIKQKDFAELSADLVKEIAKADGLNCTEAELLSACLAWAKAECKRKSLTESPENNKVVLKDIYTLIRFPNMDIADIASVGSTCGLLDQTQLVALFTYIGQKAVTKSPSMDSCLKEFSSKARKPREPLGAFSFDESSKGSMQQISNEGKTIKQTSGSNQWNTVRSKQWVKSGKYKVKFRIDGDSGTHWIFLGVVNRQFTRYNDTSSGYLGSDSNSWGYTPGGSYPYGYNGGSSRNYGVVYRQGDVVTMSLDMDAKTMGFAVNSQDFGVLYTNLPDEVAIAVTTYDTNDCVTLVA